MRKLPLYLRYVTGCVCSQLKHEGCKDSLATKDRNSICKYNPENRYIMFKEYENCKNMIYPKYQILNLTKKFTCLFNSNIDTILINNKNNVKNNFKELMILKYFWN